MKVRRYQLSGILYHASFSQLWLGCCKQAGIQIFCWFGLLVLPNIKLTERVVLRLFRISQTHQRLHRILSKEANHRLSKLEKRLGR